MVGFVVESIDWPKIYDFSLFLFFYIFFAWQQHSNKCFSRNWTHSLDVIWSMKNSSGCIFTILAFKSVHSSTVVYCPRHAGTDKKKEVKEYWCDFDCDFIAQFEIFIKLWVMIKQPATVAIKQPTNKHVNGKKIKKKKRKKKWCWKKCVFSA